MHISTVVFFFSLPCLIRLVLLHEDDASQRLHNVGLLFNEKVCVTKWISNALLVSLRSQLLYAFNSIWLLYVSFSYGIWNAYNIYEFTVCIFTNISCIWHYIVFQLFILLCVRYIPLLLDTFKFSKSLGILGGKSEVQYVLFCYILLNQSWKLHILFCPNLKPKP